MVSSKIFTEIGAFLGFGIGVTRYWDHFMSEVSIRVLDGMVITFFTTMTGAITMFLITSLLKRLFNGKQDSRSSK